MKKMYRIFIVCALLFGTCLTQTINAIAQEEVSETDTIEQDSNDINNYSEGNDIEVDTNNDQKDVVEQDEKEAVSPHDVLTSFKMKVAIDTTKYNTSTMNLSIKQVDESRDDWNRYTFDGRESVEIDSLSVGVSYTYVLNYVGKNPSNVYYYYKTNGTFTIDEDGNIASHVVDGLENSTDFDKFMDASFEDGTFSIKIKNFEAQRYMYWKKQSLIKYFKLDPSLPSDNLVIYDEFDNTILPLYSESIGLGSWYIIPRDNNGAKLRYEIHGDNIIPASGTMTSNSKVEKIIPEPNDDHHEIIIRSESSIIFKVKKEFPSIKLTGLLPSSSVSIINSTDGLDVENTNNVLLFKLADGVDEARTTISVSRTATADVQVTIKVMRDGTITVVDYDEAIKNATRIEVSENMDELKIVQILEGSIINTGSREYEVEFPAMREMIEYNGVKTSAHNYIDVKLRIINTLDEDLYLNDAQVSSINEPLNIRRSSKNAKKYIEEVYNVEHPDSKIVIPTNSRGEIIGWEYIFNFEGLTGVSLYDAILEMYQKGMINPDYTHISDLSELPHDEILLNVLDNTGGYAPSYKGDTWDGDPNADYALKVGSNNYVIIETNPKLQALYIEATYNEAVSVTFDKEMFNAPLIGEPSHKGVYYKNYISHSDENQEMMKTLQADPRYGVIPANGSITFENFRAVVDENKIFAAYQYAQVLYDLKISFKLNEAPLAQVTLTYDGNGNTSGYAPIDGNSPYTINSNPLIKGSNSLLREGYTFAGWNTRADGSGITYKEGDSITLTKNTVLYAKWNINKAGSVKPSESTSVKTSDTTIPPQLLYILLCTSFVVMLLARKRRKIYTK